IRSAHQSAGLCQRGVARDARAAGAAHPDCLDSRGASCDGFDLAGGRIEEVHEEGGELEVETRRLRGRILRAGWLPALAGPAYRTNMRVANPLQVTNLPHVWMTTTASAWEYSGSRLCGECHAANRHRDRLSLHNGITCGFRRWRLITMGL